MTETLPRRRVYFDANVYIEIVEKKSAAAQRLLRLYGGWEWQNHVIVTGEITYAEVLVKPVASAIETDDYELNDLYHRVLSVQPGVTDMLPITRSTWQRAALVRAQLKRSAAISVKLPDAVHIAAALEGRCDTFVTNDGGLQAAMTAIISRRGLSEGEPVPSLRQLITFDAADLDRLASELGCP